LKDIAFAPSAMALVAVILRPFRPVKAVREEVCEL
jgi:hypothetical protein